MLAQRAQNVEVSPTLAISAKAKQLKKEGHKVIDFGCGEPDFDTPDVIKQAAINAIREGFTKYTAANGIIELREAICKKFKADNKIEYEPSQVVVCNGAKQALYNTFMALVDKNDEVLIPRPYWVSYLDQVKLADGTPVVYETENLKVKADLIQEKITDKTKIVLLNSPSNPTGTIIEKAELEKIAQLCVEKKVFVISDEVYEKFLYDGKEHVSIASLNEDIKNLTITINAVSKTYAMTGWRIGYCAGPVVIMNAISAMQSHATSNPNSIAQKAALEAFHETESIEEMRKEFELRRNFMVERLNEIPGISCQMPEGAFYAFPNIKKTGLSGTSFSKKLLDEFKVAVVPGEAFGDDKHIRLSYATSIENIEEGLKRIGEFCKRLSIK